MRLACTIKKIKKSKACRTEEKIKYIKCMSWIEAKPAIRGVDNFKYKYDRTPQYYSGVKKLQESFQSGHTE